MYPGLIIFDCDGVLVDSETISMRCLHTALTAQGLVVSEAEIRRKFIGISARSMRSIVELDYEHSLNDDFLIQLQEQTLAKFKRELQPVPDVAAVLQQLAGPRCVASSSTLERIRFSLQLTGLWPLLTPHIYSATMVTSGKPAPDLFLHAARQMGVVAGDCIVIEDSIPGIQAAKAAGMKAVGFIGGSHLDPARQGPELIAAGADRLVNRMVELPAVLQTAEFRSSR